jgi:long-chain acyl-CoA synthetase
MTATLGELLIESGREFGSQMALRSPDVRLTYAELSAAAGALAAHLEAAGLARTRVGVLLPNLALFPIALHAVFRCGGSALLLNPANSAREVREHLADARVMTVITIERLRPLLPRETEGLLVDGFPREVAMTGANGTERVVVEMASGPLGFAAAGDEAVVIYTSAMSGRARGAVLSHRNLVANLRATMEALALSSDDAVFGALPFAHAFGLTVCLNAAMAAGSRIVPTPRFNPLTALDLLESEEITVLCGVPAMYIGLLAATNRKGVPNHRLRLALSGGAPMPLELARQWEERFGLPLRQGYGLTEASPVCLFNLIGRPNRLGTLGYPLPGVGVTIRDEAGAELPPDEVGELWVRGENVFEGYLGDRPGEGPLHGGWLRTGDLASVEDGAVRFRGTLKEMFTRNGFNVYPEEVRRVLREDPRIAEVVVWARPDPERENEVVVGVVPAPGAELSLEDVRELCDARLASYKRPSEIRITQAKPLKEEVAG